MQNSRNPSGDFTAKCSIIAVRSILFIPAALLARPTFRLLSDMPMPRLEH